MKMEGRPLGINKHVSEVQVSEMDQNKKKGDQKNKVRVLVIVLLLWTDIMTSVTYRRKHLTRDLFIVSEGKFIATMEGNTVANR